MSARPVPADAATRTLPGPWRVLAPMQRSDVDEVATIERTIYSAPWSEGNFVDSLMAGYCAWTLRTDDPRATLVGYFVLMAAVDEAHLLNLSIAASWQGSGHGLFLLRKATDLAVDHRASSVILEVRPSNARAIEVYRRFGFRDHGLRRRYYPATPQDPTTREDAIVMRLEL